MSASLGHWQVKCYSCGTYYAVPKSSRQERLYEVLNGARCPATVLPEQRATDLAARMAGHSVCGSPLAMGASGTRPKVPTTWAALHSLSVVQTTEWQALKEAAAERTALQAEVARLTADLDRDLLAEVEALKAKYETPCKGIAKTYGEDGTVGVAPCGGFIGHPGECAPVW